MAYTALQFNANALYQPVNKMAHGFQAGTVVRFNGTDFVSAQADSEGNAAVVGMVSSVPDVNSFFITQEGYVAGITLQTYTPGDTYYLDPATPGYLTNIKPTAVGQIELPCFIAYTSTSGFFFANVGKLIESGNLFQWNIVGVNTPLLVNNGYFVASGMTINLTLPTVSAIGDTIKIANVTGNFNIVQNAGQAINFGVDTTTIGAGGSITSMNKGDSIEIVCYNANTDFQVLNSMGNFTYV